YTRKPEGEPDPVWGVLAGYGLGEDDHQFYFGPAYNVAGGFSITLGAALGGGKTAELGYGVAYDISGIFESFTDLLGGNKKQSEGGGEEQPGGENGG
ncbi:MAG TPA: hypothetical protein VM283_08380, partial [Armatimonadota bacterium]|nr:hypothetical protein [Armatimonadota bacterium]